MTAAVAWRRIFDRTLAAASAACGVPRSLVCGQTRVASVFRARAVIAWILVRAFGWSLPRTGLYLCRHHTTILHSVRAVDDAIATRGRMRKLCEETIEMMLADSRARTQEAAA